MVAGSRLNKKLIDNILIDTIKCGNHVTNKELA